jgi:PPOX class probable F420-dependent enzyme
MLVDARVGHLGLVDQQGKPRVLPVTFVYSDGFLFSAVDQKPKRVEGAGLARVRYLRRRPQAAVTVDHYEDDWTKLAWVQVLGAVDVLEADENPMALEALQTKYEPYRQERPLGPLLRLAPERALWWRAVDRLAR